MPNYTEKPERPYQNSVIELFRTKLGYEYLGNWEYLKGESINRKTGVANSPIYECEVKRFLTESGYTDFQIRKVINRLKERSRLTDKNIYSLTDVNNRVYELLIYGTAVEPEPLKNTKDVMFFDFEHIERNHFAIAEEVSYNDKLTLEQSRPDIVVYVNGIALCVIELKRSIVNLMEGIKQHLSNETDYIPSFFTTTQFTVVARHAEHLELSKENRIEDGMYGFKYGTINSPYRFWCPWKKDTNKTGIVLSDTESFTDFFDKEHFMFLFRYGVLNDCGVKKVVRPHQYHALRAAEPYLEAKKGGVIWHSQGSGKSLTMIWLASYIRANFEDPRVVVITDRKELDIQLSANFKETGNNLHRAKSQDDLLNTLRNGEEWLVSTLIHKFGNHARHEERIEGERGTRIRLDLYLEELQAIIKNKFPNGFKAKGKNIFVFVDECHRTQGGRLHEAMCNIMGQDVTLIGFTGTPLLKDDKKNGYKAFCNLTTVKFGPFIHTYLNKQAVEDGVVLDLQYEARDVEQKITSKDKLDLKLAEITKGLPEKRKQVIIERWATIQNIFSSKDRIERIGYSIIDDAEASSILHHDWANAMLVAGDIYSAYRYYDFFQNISSDKFLKDRIAVVTSYDPKENDIRKNIADTAKETQEKFKYDMALQSFKNADVTSADGYEAWAKDIFIRQPSRIKLLIVVDKLLTGFDAPCATVLYLDKDMRDHSLFQALCRINRLGTDVKDIEGKVICTTHKEFGLVVDFKHLFKKIENAVTKFNDENGGFRGFDEDDIEDLLEDSIAKNKKRLLAAAKAYNSLKSIWNQNGLTNNDLLLNYYITDFPNDPAPARRESLYKITEDMTSSYENIADFMPRAGFTKEEADSYERLAREASHINLYVKQRSGDAFDPCAYDPDMRALLDRYIGAEETETIVSADADFSFLDLIDDDSDAENLAAEATEKAKGNEKAAAEVIEGKARAVINNSRDRNPERYKLLSERLQELLDELHSNKISFKEQMERLIDFIRDAKFGGNNYPKGIKTPLAKALWDKRIECGFGEDYVHVVECINKVAETREYDAPPEFRDPAGSHGQLFQKSLKENLCDLNLTQEQISLIYSIAIHND